MAIGTGGQVRPYGVAISDALQDPSSSLESLMALRDQGRRELEETGDLAGALERLDAEIEARGGQNAQPARAEVPPYGVAIHDALSDPRTTLERLTELRDQGRRTLEEQGDLAGALQRLEDEIARRG